MPPLALLQTLPEWAAVLGAYLLGSVPFGLALGLLIKGVDIRTIGSGNIGATNAGRVLGRPGALLAFALDFGKGWLPATLAGHFTPEGASPTTLAVLCGAAAVCGHCWSIYLRFQGGKGVATGCGAIVALDPLVFFLAGLAWLATLAVGRFVGLASVVMGIAFPLVAWWRMGEGRYGVEMVLGCTALTLLVIVRHRSNLRRIVEGTEPRVGQKPKDSP